MEGWISYFNILGSAVKQKYSAVKQWQAWYIVSKYSTITYWDVLHSGLLIPDCKLGKIFLSPFGISSCHRGNISLCPYSRTFVDKRSCIYSALLADIFDCQNKMSHLTVGHLWLTSHCSCIDLYGILFGWEEKCLEMWWCVLYSE